MEYKKLEQNRIKGKEVLQSLQNENIYGENVNTQKNRF